MQQNPAFYHLHENLREIIWGLEWGVINMVMTLNSLPPCSMETVEEVERCLEVAEVRIN